MDESHRLKPMQEGYDKTLFLSLHNETKSLRKKLAFEIDSRKFGVDYNEVLSWFEIKFLYTFNKYQNDPKVKGYIINALRTFKHRIILNSYLPKNHLHKTDDITEMYDFFDLSESTETDDNHNHLLELGKEYLKSIMSEDAYFLLEIQLNPPPIILKKLQNPNQKKMPKPNAEIIAEYLGIIDNEYSIEYIKGLEREINQAIKRANLYFTANYELLKS